MTKIDKSWFNDEELGCIRVTTKERLATFFEVENRAVTVGHILHKLRIDFQTIKRVIAVMIKHGLVEEIKTTNYRQYRTIRK